MPNKDSKGADFPPRWVSRHIDTALSGFWYLSIAAAMFVALKTILSIGKIDDLYAVLSGKLMEPFITMPVGAGLLLIAVVFGYWWIGRERVYLLDFECFRPADHLKVTYSRFVQGSQDSGFFSEDAMDFQTRILNKSALSEHTFFPPGLHMEPPRADMKLAREEAELVMFSAVSDLLARTGLKPKQIDILVVNCSLFNPTPSLSAMIINHFKMRSDIESYNLGGMGCSAGIISIGLARKLLGSLNRGGYALVVSTENITQNWYRGNERSMLIPNTIFRMGSAAVLLTNKYTERRRSLYELQSLVRVHLGADDAAYRCVFQHEDEDGNIGVELNKDLVHVAAKAMEINLTRLGPLVLPWGEKLAFSMNWIARRALGWRVPKYVPDFKRAFNHFCLHAGGRGVVEGLSKQLGLPRHQMAPSANALYWYGNTSSSTVWYSFAFAETVQGINTGDIVWQIGFGSGFKCNSAVWRALRPVKREHGAWRHVLGREEEAMDCIAEIARLNAFEKQNKSVDKAADVANGENGENGAHGVATNGHLISGGGGGGSTIRTRSMSRVAVH